MTEMTIGELARRTGLSVKAIREYEARGLIYTVGRSPGNYRLFDESALWCAKVIAGLRALGLTIKEIEGLAGVYLTRPEEPIGPHIAPLLTRAERRIDQRIAELAETRRRIGRYRAQNADALAGRPGADFAATDPRRGADAA
jgi:MerR family transcriptional regulator, copper efflux regulator